MCHIRSSLQPKFHTMVAGEPAVAAAGGPALLQPLAFTMHKGDLGGKGAAAAALAAACAASPDTCAALVLVRLRLSPPALARSASIVAGAALQHAPAAASMSWGLCPRKRTQIDSQVLRSKQASKQKLRRLRSSFTVPSFDACRSPSTCTCYGG